MPRSLLLAAFALLLLASCQCQRDGSEKPSADLPRAPKDLPGTDPSEDPNKLVKELKAIEPRVADALQRAPKEEATWTLLLRQCQLESRLGKRSAADCFDRFFGHANDLKLPDDTLAQAYRFRVVLALEKSDAATARLYDTQMTALHAKLLSQHQLAPEVEAYGYFLHGGVLSLTGDINGAIRETRHALARFSESPQGNKDIVTRIDYQGKLALYLAMSGNTREALREQGDLVALIDRTLGQQHPLAAEARLLLVNLLLDAGDLAAAESEWGKLRTVIGQFRSNEMPAALDSQYSQTMVRLDMAHQAADKKR